MQLGSEVFLSFCDIALVRSDSREPKIRHYLVVNVKFFAWCIILDFCTMGWFVGAGENAYYFLQCMS